MNFRSINHTLNEWALIFRNELVDIPPMIDIHADFLKDLSKEEFERSFHFIWDLFYQIYTDASEDTTIFGISVEEANKPIQRGPAGNVFCHMKQLYLLFKFGQLNGEGLNVNTNNIKPSHIRAVNSIIPVLSLYGFEFEGLSDKKITSKVPGFNIYYPENPSVIKVMFLVAKQAYMVKPYIYCKADFGDNDRLFSTWNYRLLSGAFGEYRYNNTYTLFRDSLHFDEQRRFIDTFHEEMLSHGYFIEHWPGRGGGHISYFKNSIREPYHFDVITYHEYGMYINLRIRDTKKCFTYLESCPERIKEFFRTSEVSNPDCKNLIRYNYDGVDVKKCCGCCAGGFSLKANIEDIPHYIKLLELGVNKAREVMT